MLTHVYEADGPPRRRVWTVQGLSLCPLTAAVLFRPSDEVVWGGSSLGQAQSEWACGCPFLPTLHTALADAGDLLAQISLGRVPYRLHSPRSPSELGTRGQDGLDPSMPSLAV